MGRGLSLGRIAGIKIIVHWTFLLLIGWIVFREMGKGSDTSTILITIGFVLALFFCVILHELGHSLTARRYGVETKRITLLPIGGVASLERIPEEPKQELLVAIAGPAVNMVIALLLYLLAPVRQFNMEELVDGINSWEGFLYSLYRVNILLVVFNAIPAFPMDGGRILRSLLALKMGRLRATAIASGLGRIIAIAFVFFGLFNNPFLVLIGIFVYFGAHSENLVVRYNELLKEHIVQEAMMTNYVTLAPDDTVKDAADKLLSGSDQDLVVVDNGRPVGIMNKASIIEALKENLQQTPVAEIMNTDFEVLQLKDKLNNIYTNSQRNRRTVYPVMEDGKMAGVIDLDNIQEFIMIQSALHGQ
jgi:Zn-dependent protease/predicted transcriptional regulator